MAIREGRWDCNQCGTKNILGREMACPGCGITRANDTKFYLAYGEPVVADPEQIKRANKGADWYCPYCRRGNQNDSAKCSQCGAARNTSPAPQNEKREYKENSNVSGLIKTAVASGILFLVFLSGFLIWPQRVDVEVTGFSWERIIDVMTYRTVIEEDWGVPANGHELSHQREIRSYNHVIDHYETRTRTVQTGTEEYNCGTRDLGNGYFEDITCSRAVYGNETYEEPVYRDDPIYDTKYRYKINKWVPNRTETAGKSESSTKDPQWPNIKLVGNGADILGNEREGGRSEKYIVHFISKEKKPRKFSEVFDQEHWKTFEYRAVYEAKLSFGNLSEFKPK